MTARTVLSVSKSTGSTSVHGSNRPPLLQKGSQNELFDIEPERAMLALPAPPAQRNGPKAVVSFRVRIEKRHNRPGFLEDENGPEVHPAVGLQRDRHIEPLPGMGASHRRGT